MWTTIVVSDDIRRAVKQVEDEFTGDLKVPYQIFNKVFVFQLIDDIWSIDSEVVIVITGKVYLITLNIKAVSSNDELTRKWRVIDSDGPFNSLEELASRLEGFDDIFQQSAMYSKNQEVQAEPGEHQ